MTDPEFLTQKQAAALLRVTVATIQRRRRTGDLQAIPGRPVLIPRAAVDAFLSRRMALAPAMVAAPTAAPSAAGFDAATRGVAIARRAAQRAAR